MFQKACKANDSTIIHALGSMKDDIREHKTKDTSKIGLCGLTYFEGSINEMEILIIMAGHNYIRRNIGLAKDKIILDTKNICDF